MRSQDILGMNARNQEYLQRHNTSRGRRIADSKLLTKSVLRKHKIPVPSLYKVIQTTRGLSKFDFSKISESFVVKPNNGLGGEGIIVIESGGQYAGEWIAADGRVVTTEDLKLHVEDILEGSYSMDDVADVAFIEERIRIHPTFEKYAYHGTPDVRVIVFNGVPVMAMLRIPTKESGGRANLFQGAVGAGIDMATGITTYAIIHSEEVDFMPESRRRIRGIKIPVWDKVLELAIKCQQVSGLGYLGVDLVLQPSVKNPGETLPKILELNAQPGLKIQLCNKDGLRGRLKRVEDLEVESIEKGIKIAKTLFGDRNMSGFGRGTTTISPFEEVEVVGADGERTKLLALIDTGAFSSSIDKKYAQEIGFMNPENYLYEGSYSSALGTQKRPVVAATFYLSGKKIKTKVNIADRSKRKRKFLVGRRDLDGFVVKVK